MAGHKGIAGRAAFVIAQDRKVLFAWYAPDLGTLPDPAEALAAVAKVEA